VIYDSFPTSDAETYRNGFELAVGRLDELPDDEHGARGAALGQAMDAMLGLWLLKAADAAFFDRVGAVLHDRRPAWGAWRAGLDTALWERTREGWYVASMRRSELEIVADEVDSRWPGDDVPLVEASVRAEVDDEMREIGPGIPALPADVIPRGIPDGHWWWHLPAGEPADELGY